MSQKTPFEVRADLLKMAQEHLQQQYLNNVSFASKAWEKYLETFKTQDYYSPDAMLALQKQWLGTLTKLMPPAPTVEEIISKANELYGFVQKKD